MGVLFEVDLEDVWCDFEVDGETVVVGAVPWGEVLELVFVDEELRGKTIGAVFLALVEGLVAGFFGRCIRRARVRGQAWIYSPTRPCCAWWISRGGWGSTSLLVDRGGVGVSRP